MTVALCLICCAVGLAFGFIFAKRCIWSEEPKQSVSYICDLNQCANCSYPKCNHTTDINHAANFLKLTSGIGETYFWEVDKSDDTMA